MIYTPFKFCTVCKKVLKKGDNDYFGRCRKHPYDTSHWLNYTDPTRPLATRVDRKTMKKVYRDLRITSLVRTITRQAIKKYSKVLRRLSKP